jgi:hypothetical protein
MIEKLPPGEGVLLNEKLLGTGIRLGLVDRFKISVGV